MYKVLNGNPQWDYRQPEIFCKTNTDEIKNIWQYLALVTPFECKRESSIVEAAVVHCLHALLLREHRNTG